MITVTCKNIFCVFGYEFLTNRTIKSSYFWERGWNDNFIKIPQSVQDLIDERIWDITPSVHLPFESKIDYIVTCRVVRMTKITGSISDDWNY
jgi:hypothetical protein